jgi:hypothetical protein
LRQQFFITNMIIINNEAKNTGFRVTLIKFQINILQKFYH